MMPCGSSKPLANQLNSGIFACQMAQRTSVDEARLHLRRTVNYLVGPQDPNYVLTVGGMRYEPTKTDPDDRGLGQGIIPDLKKVQQGGYKLQPLAAEGALEAAESARSLGETGLNQNDIGKLQQAAKDVASQLQSALNAVLA